MFVKSCLTNAMHILLLFWEHKVFISSSVTFKLWLLAVFLTSPIMAKEMQCVCFSFCVFVFLYKCIFAENLDCVAMKLFFLVTGVLIYMKKYEPLTCECIQNYYEAVLSSWSCLISFMNVFAFGEFKNHQFFWIVKLFHFLHYVWFI